MLLKKIFNRFLDHNMNKVKSYKPDDQISLSSNHLISFSSKIAIISAIRLDALLVLRGTGFRNLMRFR